VISLHKLLDAHPHEVRTTDLNPQRARFLFDSFRRTAPSAICYWVGDIDAANGRVVPELCRLPFPICWFEFAGQPQPGQASRFGVLAVRGDAAGAVSLSCFRRFGNDQWEQNASLLSPQLASREYQIIESSPIAEDIALAGRRAVCLFLSALHCRNVVCVDHVAPERLNAKRAKSGRPLIFSFKTLVLEPTKRTSSGETTETEAHRRLHIVCGHPRRLPGEGWTWVREHWRGDETLGVVHKQYDGSRVPTLYQ